MNLQWQIQIVDGLIKEDPDATIADYMELVKELSIIESTNASKQRPRYLNDGKNHTKTPSYYRS